jgi:hypothetical protein
VETKCLTCYGPFTFGEEVCLCTQCGGCHHASCWDSSGGCTHPAGVAAARGATVIEGAGAIPPPLPPPMTYAPPPPAPVGYGTPPPPMQPQALAPDEQYCPRCGNIVKNNALVCHFCNTSFSYPQAPVYPGQPYGNMFGGTGSPGAGYGYAQAEAEKKASSARTCGMISLITIITTNVISFFAVASQSEEFLRLFISIRPLFGLIGISVLVLAIVAVVKGSGAKRLMNQFPVDPRVRSKATTGQVMGWITLGIALLGIIVAASGGLRNFR